MSSTSTPRSTLPCCPTVCYDRSVPPRTLRLKGTEPAKEGTRPARASEPPRGDLRGAGDILGGFFSQNKILAGAAEVFRHKGIEAATVADILVAAGVSRRTFYKVFTNKEDVLVALHRGLSELFMQAMRAAVAESKDGPARMRRCVDVFLLAAQRSSGLMLQLQAEAQRRDRLAERRQAMFRELVEMIQEGYRDEGRPTPDPLLVYGLLIGLEGVVRFQMEAGRVTDSDLAHAREVMLQMLDGALTSALPP